MQSSQRLAHQERKLNEESVRKILTSEENDGKLSKTYGVTRALIGRIRVGKIYADVAPELPRRQRQVHVLPTCMNCALFTGNENNPCSLCLPEATSTAAARWCGSFYPAEGEPELEAC
jgi:homoserine dehydrogenase